MRQWHWRDDALCAEPHPTLEPDDWFRIGEDRSFEARHLAALRTVCDACPVKAECLEYAVVNEPDWGVWAGTTPRQRAFLRRGVA